MRQVHYGVLLGGVNVMIGSKGHVIMQDCHCVFVDGVISLNPIISTGVCGTSV